MQGLEEETKILTADSCRFQSSRRNRDGSMLDVTLRDASSLSSGTVVA